MNKYLLAVSIFNQVLMWYGAASQDGKVDPEEIVALLRQIAEQLGKQSKLEIKVEAVPLV